ncbi:hypothetical protein BC567DRAFT_275684 [Phyllosticta citribraziliensis]
MEASRQSSKQASFDQIEGVLEQIWQLSDPPQAFRQAPGGVLGSRSAPIVGGGIREAFVSFDRLVDESDRRAPMRIASMEIAKLFSTLSPGLQISFDSLALLLPEAPAVNDCKLQPQAAARMRLGPMVGMVAFGASGGNWSQEASRCTQGSRDESSVMSCGVAGVGVASVSVHGRVPSPFQVIKVPEQMPWLAHTTASRGLGHDRPDV